MTRLEEEAMQALGHVSMQIASGGKRFYRDMESQLRADPGFQMTAKQALYMWSMVHMYRRQITSARLRDLAERIHFGQTPDGILEFADHRIVEGRKVEVIQPKKKTKYDEELEKGGGRLKL